MSKDLAQQDSEAFFTTALYNASNLPLIKVSRDKYLRNELKNICTPEQLEKALKTTPSQAGVSAEALNKIADGAIAWETTQVTAISTVAGIPGGLAMIGTIPVDMAQQLGYMLRVAQKLAYIYGWPSFESSENSELDDATKNLLTLFVGVMFGVDAAKQGVTKASALLAQTTMKKLPQQALTKGAIYPIVKQVAAIVGVKMTKDVFAKGVSKAIPILGGVLSGGLTLATFLPMAHNLKGKLAELDAERPDSAPALEAE